MLKPMAFVPAAFALLAVGCLYDPESSHEDPSGVGESFDALTTTSPHLMLGTPVDATPADDFVMTKVQYALSYNNPKRVPNWVSWKVQASDLGNAARTNSFRSDTSLPAGFISATNADYKGSGYSRGHMCPSADRTSSASANSETFIFSNIVPQTTELNSGPWQQLETYERAQAMAGKDVYIVAGSVFPAVPKTIGASVAVPSRNYKIVVILPHGATLADVTATTPIVAVDMPNDKTALGKAWGTYKVSMANVEQLSGYRFLTAVAPAVHDALAGGPAAPVSPSTP
jgi:endonuclease G